MHSGAPVFVPDSVLRRHNHVWRNQTMRLALEREQAASQLNDIEHCRIALSCLVQEACRHDQVVQQKQKKTHQHHHHHHHRHHDEQERVSRWIQLEDEVINSADEYQGAVAKLSSMMMWEDARRRFDYDYHESELYLRRANQIKTLQALEAQAMRGGCKFFLGDAPVDASTGSDPTPIVAPRNMTQSLADIAASLGPSDDEEEEDEDDIAAGGNSDDDLSSSNSSNGGGMVDSGKLLINSPSMGPASHFDMSASSSACESPMMLPNGTPSANSSFCGSSVNEVLAACADTNHHQATGRALLFSPLSNRGGGEGGGAAGTVAGSANDGQ